MELIDTHAHLDFDAFDADREAVLARAADVGVHRIINVGTSLSASEHAARLAERHEHVYAAAGIHPSDATAVDAKALAGLKRLIEHPKVVAVGEIGFDFHHDKNETEEVQSEAFWSQAKVASEANLPLIIHSRDAEELTYRQLWEYADGFWDEDALAAPGVVHCFTGSLGFAQQLIDEGFLISFTAPITYPQNEVLREVVKAIPLDRLMVETDAPFLPPADKRGERNEPAFVVETGRAVAEIKGISLAEVATATTRNAERLFGLS